MRRWFDGMTDIDQALARLLSYGTWTACLFITLGLAWPHSVMGVLLSRPSLVNVGVAIFIALPVIRVVVMLGNFLTTRDHRFAIFALAVLLIIAAGLCLGIAAP